MEQYEVHRLAAALETRNKLKSLLKLTQVPKGITITVHSGNRTRSVTMKEWPDTTAFVRAINERIDAIEKQAVDLGVVFNDDI